MPDSLVERLYKEAQHLSVELPDTTPEETLEWRAAVLIERQSAELAALRERVDALETDVARRSKSYNEQAEQMDALREQFERECKDADALLIRLNLPPDQYRTEGGSLNVPKIATALREQVARLEKDAGRYRWLRDSAHADIRIMYVGKRAGSALDGTVDAQQQGTPEG